MSMAAFPFRFKQRPLVVVMGVCGCGKSTIGSALAGRLDLPFLEGDEYHPQSNVDKMAQGLPLSDEDRWPWLSALGLAMRKAAKEKGGGVCACSALKRDYRQHLSDAVGAPVLYVLLDESRASLLQRLQARKGHYMPVSLLDSQLAILERPGPDEFALTFSCEAGVEAIAKAVQTITCWKAK